MNATLREDRSLSLNRFLNDLSWSEILDLAISWVPLLELCLETSEVLAQFEKAFSAHVIFSEDEYLLVFENDRHEQGV